MVPWRGDETYRFPKLSNCRNLASLISSITTLTRMPGAILKSGTPGPRSPSVVIDGIGGAALTGIAAGARVAKTAADMRLMARLFDQRDFMNVAPCFLA